MTRKHHFSWTSLAGAVLFMNKSAHVHSGLLFSTIRNTLALATGLIVAFVAGMADDTAKAEQPLPPQAKFRRNTVTQWSLLHNEWAIGVGLGGGSSIPDTVKGMRFLPPGFGPGDFEFDLTVPPGTGLVSSPFFAFGELYEDGTYDDPEVLAPVIELIFQERFIAVWLDGELVQAGTPAELSGFTYGPTFFDEPIFYTEPQDRGPDFPPAIAALWTVGVGGVYHPLPPGEHTLMVMSDGPVFGPNSFVYHITVEK